MKHWRRLQPGRDNPREVAAARMNLAEMIMGEDATKKLKGGGWCSRVGERDGVSGLDGLDALCAVDGGAREEGRGSTAPS